MRNVKKIVFIFVFSLFISLVGYAPESYSAEEKSVDIPITADYNGCTFTVTMEKEGDYTITLYAPNNEAFYFEQKHTNSTSYVCTVTNVKSGTWKIVVNNNSDEEVGKISVDVSTAKTEDNELDDDIVIGKEVVGLNMYLKNNTFIASWTDDSCASVTFTITDLDTSREIISKKSTEKYFEYVLGNGVKNISVEVVSSRTNGIEGAQNTYVINGLSSIDGTIEFPDVSFTNEDEIYVNTTINSPYAFYIEVNGREVARESEHPAGTYEVTIPLIDDGENLIQFYMVDKNGNMLSEDYTVFRDDTAPILTLSQEYDGITTEEKSITINGVAQDYDEFTINGEVIKTEKNGAFSYDTNLSVGENKITLLLKDKAGNETFYNISITVPEKETGFSPVILLIVAVIILFFTFFGNKKKKRKVSKTSQNALNGSLKEEDKESNAKEEKTPNFDEYESQNDNSETDIFMKRKMLKSHDKENPLTKSRRFLNVIGGWKYVLYVILLILFFQFILKPGHITSGSMEPTIMTDDIVIYNRLAYLANEPKVNDIISFKHEGETYCKRIIGVAGDEIFFADGYVYRNGERIEEKFLDEDIETNCTKTFTVPEGMVFVLGDNRENSYDSRYWENPFVDIKNIHGKQLIVIPMHN